MIKNGKVIENILNIQPKEGFVTLDEVNRVYTQIRNKIDPKKIMIKLHTITGFVTAKSFDNDDFNLEVLVESYYSIESRTMSKYKQVLGFQIITK